MHHVGHFDDSALIGPPVYLGHSEGYRQAELVNRATGSVHTGLSMNELAPAARSTRTSIRSRRASTS